MPLLQFTGKTGRRQLNRQMDFVYFDQLLKGTLVLIRCIPQGNQSTAINNFNYKRNPPESTISFAFDHLA